MSRSPDFPDLDFWTTLSPPSPCQISKMATKRMTANPVKAPRYRPGKGLAEEVSSSDSSDNDEEAPQTKAIPPPPKVTTASGISSNLKKVDLDERRKLAAAQEVARIEEAKAAKAKEEEGFVTESEGEESEDGSSGSEEDSQEEESEDDVPRRVMLRPTFVRKDKRQALGSTAEKDVDEEAVLAAEEARKKAAADAIVEEQIARDIAAKEAGKKSWDDNEDSGDEVDDTDGLDPEAEYAAWKLRELKRIKREREAIAEREKDAEEIERRKNLTEEERKAEDDAFLAKQKEERKGRGQMAYMQKYYHKGAFYQDDAKAEGLERREIMGAKYADDVNRELLPQALQIRDMTKIGKKGATKYRDLKTEDTGKWGEFGDRRPGKGGFGGFGADERFRPDRERGGTGASGANSTPVAERKKVQGAPAGPKSMQEGSSARSEVDTYRPSAGKDDRRRLRSWSPRRKSDRDERRHSRSRTPPRRRDRSERRRSRSRSANRSRHRGDRRHKRRSYSRSPDRYESDKRRRVDSRS